MFNTINDVNIHHKFNQIISKYCVHIHPIKIFNLIENNKQFIQIIHYRSSRIYFSGPSGEYVARERCHDDYYALTTTPMPLSESIGNTAIIQNPSNSGISPPLSITVQQQPNQMQSSLSQQQANVQSGKIQFSVLTSLMMEVLHHFRKSCFHISIFYS